MINFAPNKNTRKMLKLIPKSHFIKDTTSDSVKTRQKLSGDKTKNLPLLYLFENIWTNFEYARNQRKRNFRYVFGDQWGDMVKDDNGALVQERKRIEKRLGGIALQNNHLFKVVNSITGVYTKSANMPVVFARQENADMKSQMMTNALQTNYENNQMNELLVDGMQELVCGGYVSMVEEWTCHEGKEDAYTYKVNPDYIAWRCKGGDPRMWDIDIIGEIRDYNSVGELASDIGESEYDFKQIEAIYARWMQAGQPMDEVTAHDKANNITFLTPPTRNLLRTFHIWTLEYKPCYRIYDPLDNEQPIYRIDIKDKAYIDYENNRRSAECMAQGMAVEDYPLIEFRDTDKNGRPKQHIQQYWHFQMLSPEGYILTEYDSPWEHGSHPYSIVTHNYVNGIIYPFIGVIIDQQRYINRLISLHDLAIQSSAKGLKMIPTNVLGGMSPRQFAKQFVEIGDFVFYTPDAKTPNFKPEVITTNSTNIGTSELLKLEVDWINEISTVSGALQGAQAQSGTAASRYAMEMQNSITAVSTLFQKYNNFEMRMANKKMKVIHQKYQEPRNISIKHSNGFANFGMYEPKAVEDIDFSVSIKQGAETPVARMAINDLVKEMWMKGVLSAKQMLKYGYFEGSEQIIQDLEAAEEQAAQQGGMPMGIGQQGQQAIAEQANPDVVSLVQQAIRGAA